jgi:hypothetical protein
MIKPLIHSPSAARSVGRVDARRADGWGFSAAKSSTNVLNGEETPCLRDFPCGGTPPVALTHATLPTLRVAEGESKKRRVQYPNSARTGWRRGCREVGATAATGVLHSQSALGSPRPKFIFGET